MFRLVLRKYCIFFFKQKTAYEMRISDWSSDVCSSDLGDPVWFYSLDWRSPAFEGRLKASHSIDTPLVFDTPDLCGPSVAGPEAAARSEERRVGEACVSTCSSRWSRHH